MFKKTFESWMHAQLADDSHPRRQDSLKHGLNRSSIEFLRSVWYPAVGHFDHLHAEWEVIDLNSGYRYIDFAYMPGGSVKVAIEIQGYGPHARDLEISRFKDLCWRHSLLTLDGWTLFPVAFPSILDEPEKCRQLILAIIGKYMSPASSAELTWAQAELIRYARRKFRPITPREAAHHLRLSPSHTRRILHSLVELQKFEIANGKQRRRTYKLKL
ncbi:MAG TPA: transcriptional regulator [Bacillales bacterium]|nr:transcriptional regulator [Bacillales bacterium]